MPDTDKAKQPSARSRLRVFIRREIKGKSEVDLAQVTNRSIRYVTKDKTLLKAVLLELLRPMVYEEARLVIADSREGGDAPVPTNNLVQLGDEVVSRGALRERAAKVGRKWLAFMEHAGSRYVLLMDMTADDLALAEAERRKRGDAEYGYADLWAKLRTRLESGQRVRDVWSTEEIEAVRRELRVA